MIWIPEDRYESPFSIDTNPFVWRYNGDLIFIVTKNRILQIFAENMLIFKFSPKILGKCGFEMKSLL